MTIPTILTEPDLIGSVIKDPVARIGPDRTQITYRKDIHLCNQTSCNQIKNGIDDFVTVNKRQIMKKSEFVWFRPPLFQMSQVSQAVEQKLTAISLHEVMRVSG